MKTIAFLVQLPQKASPSQRFRIEQFEPALIESGYSLDTFPFIDKNTYRVFYKKGHIMKKTFGVIMGFIRRIGFLFIAGRYDFIFLQREASPVGPPVFEWILHKILRRKLILDFDDAIWISDPSGSSAFIRSVKCYWKIRWICKWSHKVAVGNDFLADYARRYNSNVVLIPTCVDVKYRYNRLKDQSSEKVVIGWTGSHSTLKYLDMVAPVLKNLEDHFDFTFLVICSRPPDFHLRSMKFIPWTEATEIEDLLKMNIGIMPLVEDVWSEGKCGFKIIQYMALGMPAIASPVGVNKEIIENGKNGFLCSTGQEWTDALSRLIRDQQLRTAFGRAGREKIIEFYSVHQNVGKFLSLFR